MELEKRLIQESDEILVKGCSRIGRSIEKENQNNNVIDCPLFVSLSGGNITRNSKTPHVQRLPKEEATTSPMGVIRTCVVPRSLLF